MSGIVLKGGRSHLVTAVPNMFIDLYMAEANGEFVKIYLYLLRNLALGDVDISISSMADIFNHTEKDVLRALGFWEKKGILSLSRDGRGDLNGIEIVDIFAAGEGERFQQESAAAKTAPVKKETKRIPREVHSVESLRKLADDKDFTDLMYIAQQYIGTTLKPADCDKFAYLYHELNFSVELLEYLIEYCVSNGQKSIRYMESVALDWHGRGIMSVERAKDYTSAYNKECFMVMKAFGIADRRPATIEKQMIDKWFYNYDLPAEVILEACNRTIKKIHQPSFEYADKILAGWKEQGVKHKADIEVLDNLYRSQEQKTKKTANKNTAKPGNKFHNFEQRGYDYDELLNKMK